MTGIRPSLISASRRRFNPLSLSPALWLDASDSSTLFDATSGGSLVAADGAVARWEDKSQNGRHVTQNTSNRRPIYKATSFSGVGALRFNQFELLRSAETYAITSGFSFFVVFRLTGSRGVYERIVTIGNSGGDHNWSAGHSTDAVYGRYYFGGNAGFAKVRDAVGSADTDNDVILSFSNAGDVTSKDQSSLRRNGLPLGLTEFSAIVAQSDNQTFIGGREVSGTPGFLFRGDIAEILIFPTALSTADRQRVESYLSQKYNIALA